MKSYFFKLFLLITFLFVSNGDLLAQYEWEEWPTNPLAIHGSSGSWDASVVTPCVIFNSDLNRFEMWYTSFNGFYPNGGIGFAYSSDGINWTKHPTAVLTPSSSSWDNLFVGVACVLNEGGIYKMWYTGGQSGNLSSSHIGYATSPDGIVWTKYSGNPILSPLTGWEYGAVGYPSVVKISGTYYMFYSGAVTVGIARTGRAISSDGITWTRYAGNPVLPAGDVGQWDRNNYLGKVIAIEDTLYMYYTGEISPGVTGSAIGMATSIDTGKTWNKYTHNPIITSSFWNSGWTESGSVLFSQKKLWLYYDGGSTSGGRIGFATTFIVSVEDETILPTEFALEQNHPNPFNPSTIISWQSPVGSHQTLKIFDVLGNEIATLVDEYKPAGKYEVEFDSNRHSRGGGNLTSGVYFYQLKAGDFVSTMKMLLIK